MKNTDKRFFVVGLLFLFFFLFVYSIFLSGFRSHAHLIRALTTFVYNPPRGLGRRSRYPITNRAEEQQHQFLGGDLLSLHLRASVVEGGGGGVGEG